MDTDINNIESKENIWNVEAIKTVELKIIDSILECKTVMRG